MESRCVGSVARSISVGETSSVDGRLGTFTKEGEVVFAWRFPSVTSAPSSETLLFYNTLTTATDVDSLPPTATRLWTSTYISIHDI
jgi:hypothetical protein